MSVTPQRRYQDVAAELRDLIRAEGFRPGDRLLTERQIALRLDVGRSLVRDAIIMLEVEGLVQVRQGSGIYLMEPAAPATVSVDDIGPFELLEARMVIESAVAGLAAATVTKADITAMRDALDQERRNIEGGSDDYSGDRRFHLLIAEATQNGVLVGTVTDLWDRRRGSRMWAQLHSRIFDHAYRNRWLDDHQEILDALRARDSMRARKAMSDHIGNVSATLMQLSDPDDPSFDGYLFSTARARQAL
ncbi:FCD domain-containing protein [Paracoccus sp. 1_MG-2023]|uniref:FCD domain-containing protein n=1 Tax=unclassified Paracoccus (in: a-proteobacteria) TaxID=2688777 RepID=UPI001C08D9A4|nr:MULTISPECIES: FCD domain-containing protein [unclassified Paracoccus (in: a-proteobacteria)]MBU2956039.1 FCD domain-containing protein [Paracoccus sp. C2R09]MDO6669445.1 FCD domain-containing protein [Paracoccus sp. 1_MG-2023]